MVVSWIKFQIRGLAMGIIPYFSEKGKYNFLDAM